ncbi:hypothetical protein TMatcc_008032 [Talaromyces marneffei ATCC 18224]
MNNLPIELLEQICTTLCPHCTHIDRNDRTSCCRALASLSCTNQLLRAIAQPILFHRLKLSRRSSCAFLRMLYERPHLASKVKQLSPLWQQLFFDGSDEDHQILERAARELLLDIDGNTGFDELYGDNPPKHFLTELMIALLPNLESFVAEIEYSIPDEDLATFYRFLDSRFKRLEPQNGGISGLPNIRALGFTKEGSWGFSLATPGIAVLLNAAPNLERLVFDGTHGVGGVYREWVENMDLMASGLRNLRVLSITNSVLGNNEEDFEFGQLRRIVQLCIRLEVFRFNSIGLFPNELDDGHLPPGRFVEALDSVKETLTGLDIDIGESCPPEPADDWMLTSQSMTSFERLESLRLDELSFCLHWVDVVTDRSPRSSTTCLTDILPETVRFLTEFPRLESVIVEQNETWGGRTMKHAVREAFEQSRARLSFVDRGYYYGEETQFDDVYDYDR